MCGIAGIVDRTTVDTHRLLRMSQILQHRGPDDEGFYVSVDRNKSRFYCGDNSINEVSTDLPHVKSIEKTNEPSHVGFVHRRLSILDLSGAGHQPMVTNDDRYVLTFNGEIYNYLEIRDELASLGYSFRSATDTEVLLTGWQHWGSKVLDKCIGMWAFALHDREERKVYLVRDRYGIKPLYYAVNEDSLVFASELKAIIRTQKSRPQIEHKALREFCLLGRTLEPHGILIDGVNEIAAGSMLVIDEIYLSSDSYQYYDIQSFAHQKIAVASDSAEIDNFVELLQKSINIHLRSDVPVGVCLSGGLDSSFIAAYLANEKMSGSLYTFTAGYRDKSVDESHLAKLIADKYPAIQPTFTFPDIEHTWSSLDRQIYHHDVPFHSSSMFAQWDVMESVNSKGLKVVMNGQGADEMLGGYSPFIGIYLIELLKKLRIMRFIHEYRCFSNHRKKSLNTALYRALFAYLPAYFRSAVRARKRIGSSIIRSNILGSTSSTPDRSAQRKSFVTATIDSINHGLQGLLRYEDRISMAFSVESRVPFLDHRLVEHAISMSIGSKIQNGWTKYPIRHGGKNLVPDAIRWRKDKMGFLTPAEEWLRLKRVEIEEYMSSTKYEGIIDSAIYRKELHAESSDPSHYSELWKIFILAKWLEAYDVAC